MTAAYALILVIEVFLLGVCVVCEIMEVINPKTRAFEKVRVFVFLATIPIFPVLFHFFGMFIDFSIFLEFIKDVPELISGMFDMFRGCVPII